MSRRSIVRSALAAFLALGMVGTALAQSNVAQTIRYGEVVSMEKTMVKDRSTGTGARTGATVGAVAGYALAGGRDRWLGALVGGAIGGAAGSGIEKSARKKRGFQLIILLEETGEEIGIQVKGKKQDFGVGDRVRLLTAGGETKVTQANK